MITYASIHNKVTELLQYIQQGQLTIRLDKVIAGLEDVQGDCLAEIQSLPEAPAFRPIKQITSTPDCVYALCEDGTVWGYDQSATWKQVQGIEIPKEPEHD